MSNCQVHPLTRPIGVFDSGYGGLTVLRNLVGLLPQYDYVYLGDNARTPYGNRSFEAVHKFTWESVQHLFRQECPLVVLACNTASAKALRTIQQSNLLPDHPDKKVLGVIRPTTEIIGNLTRTGKVGIFATAGTVASESYIVEIARFFPELQVFQQACPMWVPLVENHEINGTGTDYFVEKYVQALLAQCSEIDTIVLGCTHYPLLLERIRQFLPPHVKVLAQGEIVAGRLADYLDRHPEIETRLTRGGARIFLTTDDPRVFDRLAGVFYGDPVSSRNINLQSSNSAL